MKKSLGVLAVFMSIILLSAAAYGATDNVFEGMGKKLFRGITNVLTGWVELPAQMIKEFVKADYEGGNPVLGVTYGFFKGINDSIGRTASGIFEVAGFWAANPKDDWGMGIYLDAEYAWQEGHSYDYSDPNVVQGTLKPMGNKFLRGMENTLFGFAELPGQIGKGIKERAVDLGIVKGLWFSLSREICGITDLATAIVPGPEESRGYPFDEKYPWNAMIGLVDE